MEIGSDLYQTNAVTYISGTRRSEPFATPPVFLSEMRRKVSEFNKRLSEILFLKISSYLGTMQVYEILKIELEI